MSPERDAKARPDTPTLTVYLVPHTHWDREWYQPFQVFRARLVDVIDSILELLEGDHDYRRFTLDGQAIVLEDYLALRPEMRGAIEAQVRAGRLRIGPWYVLADEFLVSPEALVRNLHFGRRVCRSFGPVMPVGYTPDSFGHISQLPLLARGFDLDSIVFQRGVGDEGERLRGEFRWLAADGASDVFAVHLLGTYSAAAGIGHADWEMEDRYDGARAVHQVRAVLFGPDGEVTDLPDWLQESFDRLPNGVAPYSTNSAVLLLNGSDHLYPQPNVPAIVAELNADLPEARFLHADIEEFVAAARRPLDSLETFQGEFRGSRYQHVLSGVLSARVYLKQANNAAETRIERYAEPLASLAWLAGAAYPDHLLREAWRQLLQNHPHDSICGCSIDSVHDEMLVRFAAAEQLAGAVTSRALQHFGVPAGNATDNGVGQPESAGDALLVFNPLPYARTTTVAHTLELPAGRAASLGVADAEGRPLPVQVDVEPVFAAGRSDRTVDRTRLRFTADLPSLGLAGFRLTERGAAAAQVPVAQPRGNGFRLQNVAVRVDVDADGAVSVTHLPSGARTPLRLAFEDEADAGDEYDFSPVAGEASVRFEAPAGPPELITNGPVEASVRLHFRGELPARLTADRSKREGRAPLRIDLDISLDATEPLVRLRARIDNRAEDHRLRLRLNSGRHSERVLADGHFDVLERPVGPPAGDHWFQVPAGTSHQRRFVAVTDGEHGLALLNRGLPEYEAAPGEHGVELRVTLLRCVGWLSREDLRSRPQGAGPALATPGAQMPGEHVFELAVLPFEGAWDAGPLIEQAQGFQAPPLVGSARHASAPRSWMTLPRLLELTAVKRAEDRDSLILRVFNPGRRRVRGALDLWDVPAEVHRVNLAEDRREALESASSSLELDLGPKEVVTLELVPQERKGGTAPSRQTRS